MNGIPPPAAASVLGGNEAGNVAAKKRRSAFQGNLLGSMVKLAMSQDSPNWRYLRRLEPTSENVKELREFYNLLDELHLRDLLDEQQNKKCLILGRFSELATYGPGHPQEFYVKNCDTHIRLIEEALTSKVSGPSHGVASGDPPGERCTISGGEMVAQQLEPEQIAVQLGAAEPPTTAGEITVPIDEIRGRLNRIEGLLTRKTAEPEADEPRPAYAGEGVPGLPEFGVERPEITTPERESCAAEAQPTLPAAQQEATPSGLVEAPTSSKQSSSSDVTAELPSPSKSVPSPDAHDRKTLYRALRLECRTAGVRMNERVLAKRVNPKWNTRDPIAKWKQGKDRPGDDAIIRATIAELRSDLRNGQKKA